LAFVVGVASNEDGGAGVGSPSAAHVEPNGTRSMSVQVHVAPHRVQRRDRHLDDDEEETAARRARHSRLGALATAQATLARRAPVVSASGRRRLL
jgi:hypothetical protein